MGELLHLRFVEASIHEKEIITFHIPRSKKLPDNHAYFDKRIIWTLIKWGDTEDYPYEAIEEDEKNGIRYQEIHEEIINDIHGISNVMFEEEINLKDCFAFEYTPSELDRLILRSDYLYTEIKAVQQPYNRAFTYMSFTYKNEFWEIDKEENKRIAKKYLKGVVEATLEAV